MRGGLGLGVWLVLTGKQGMARANVNKVGLGLVLTR